MSSAYYCYRFQLTLTAYLSLRIPHDAPFELKASPEKGWGAFSTTKIPCGALILEEQPLFTTNKDHTEFDEGEAQAAFQLMSPEAKQQFLCLRDNGCEPFPTMAHAWAENSFSMYNKSQSRGSALFVLMSRFDHSCIPNAKIPVRDSEAVAIFAVRNIEVGEEITFCYNPGFAVLVALERRRALGFICECQACRIDTPFQYLSDARRTLLRGLEFLTQGKEIVEEGQAPRASIIFDSQLRKQAQEFDISISSRFIYYLLTVYLLEEEGLLDGFRLERLMPGITVTKNCFENRSNVKLARLALAQPTWFGRVCVAFSMYGREDVADQETSVMFRAMDELRINISRE
jgi:hypothetical protein